MKNSEPETNNKVKIFTKSFTLASLINLFIFFAWQGMLSGLPLYSTANGADTVYAGLLTTVAALAALIARPLSGIAVDSLGRKRVLIISTLVMIALSFGYLVFPTGTLGLVVRALHGFAWGFASTANSTLPLDIISPKRFAESMAFFGIFSSAAMSLAPTVANSLSESGHDDMIIFVSIISTVITLALSIYFFNSGYKEPVQKKELSFKDSFKLSHLIFKDALFPSIVICLLSITVGTLSTFFGLMCEDRGLNDTAIYFITFAVFSIVLKPLVGRFTDRRGYYLIGLISLIFLGGAMFVVAFTNSNLFMFLSGALVGIGQASASTILQAMAVGKATPTTRGAATSTYWLFLNLGVSLGGLIGGILVDSVNYTGMFIVMGCICFVAAIVFLAGGRKRVNSYNVKQPENN